MTTGMNNARDRLEVSGPDVVVVHDRPAAGLTVTGAPEPPRSSGRRWLLIAALLVLAVAAAVLAFLVSGDDNVATEPATQSQPKAAGATAGRPLITIESPATVVAGQPATFTVNYELMDAKFSGSIEEWGDGVGVGSAKQERCESSAQTAGPSSGRYSASHTWTRPGTYEVVLGVQTYSCSGTESRDAKATRTLSVTVVAP